MQVYRILQIFLYIVVLLFINCAAGNIWLTIQADGSGQLQFVKKEFKERRTTKLEFIKEGSVQESEIHITSMDLSFSRLDDFDMDGASFIFYKPNSNNPQLQCLLLTLDTSSESPWFSYFSISPLGIRNFQKEMKSRDDLARFNNLTDYIVWEIKLPGHIVSVKDFEPLGPDWWLSNHNNRKAILKIPAVDILNSRRKFSTYEICSDMGHKY